MARANPSGTPGSHKLTSSMANLWPALSCVYDPKSCSPSRLTGDGHTDTGTLPVRPFCAVCAVSGCLLPGWGHTTEASLAKTEPEALGRESPHATE